jgi:hypothetical protein
MRTGLMKFFLISAVLTSALVALPVFSAEKAHMKLRTRVDEGSLPKVIRVERTSPVFKNPSAKSKILADVDMGTVLIARSVSPKGSWILVEDEDGNSGWMPVNRTNYKSLAPTKEIVSDEEIKDAEKDNQEAEAETEKIPPLGVVAIEATVSNFGFGGDFSYLIRQSMDSPFSRERRIGIEIGAYRDWDADAASTRNYTLPLHFRMMAREPGAGFVSGPDLGASYRVKDSSWGSGLGYSIGYVSNESTGIATRVRAGIEWGGKTRHLFSWSLGWVF